MRTSITYNGLPAVIITPNAELRSKLNEAKMLAELGIYDTLTVTIQHQDSKPFDVPVSSLCFDWQGNCEDRIQLAGLRAMEDNLQFAIAMKERYPNMEERSRYTLEVEYISLYLLCGYGNSQPSAGTWNTYEPVDSFYNEYW